MALLNHLEEGGLGSVDGLWTMRTMKEKERGIPMVRKLYEVGGVILVWIVANFLGVAAIGVVILILPFLRSIPGMLVSDLGIGLPIALAQWIALRRVAPISILWVLTISAGLLLGHVVGPILAGTFWGFLDDESALGLTALCATFGLLVGLAQWIFLRGHFPKSWVWPLGSAVGLGLGIALILASDLINQSGEMSIILVVLVYAMVTGLAISWLSVSRRKTERNLVNAT